MGQFPTTMMATIVSAGSTTGLDDRRRYDLAHDLALPTLLFAALGGMTWAVRGCSGFGAVAGCVFAGVTWGTAWWFLAHDPRGEPSRRYASGWVVLALTVGIGVSGARGWMQWPSFFEGRLMTDAAKGQYVPIPRVYGFLWMFLAGVPWAGLGACLLAWCGSLRETRVWHWVVRIACGLGAGFLARYLFGAYPQFFLPLYGSLESRYHNLSANPSLRRLINDCGAGVTHLGYYLGFLLYEVVRKERKNVILILTVGLLNGLGWALCQCWKWAPHVWPDARFNYWRCWESSGGISIGIAFGVAYFLVNRRMSDEERVIVASRRALAGPNFEWLLVYIGLAWIADLFLRSQMGGWGPWYLTVVLLFGAGYCLLGGRRQDGDGVLEEARPGALASRIEGGTACLALSVIFLALLLMPGRPMSRQRMIDAGSAMTLGVVWFLVRRRTFEAERMRTTPPGGGSDPNLERLGLYLGLLTGLGLSVRNGLKGWFNIYLGHEEYWSRVLWQYLGPLYLAALVAITGWILFRPRLRRDRGPLFPHAYGLMWLVLLVQNLIAQLVTGPHTAWSEMAFSLYYALLFFITATIVFHFHTMKAERVFPGGVRLEPRASPHEWPAQRSPGSTSVQENGS